MLLRKTAALLLAMLFAAAALADTAIAGFITSYNSWAGENSAPVIDISCVYSDDNGWYISFDGSSCILGISFDSYGDADILMLDADTDDKAAVKALLNAWFVSDGGVIYSEIEAIVAAIAEKHEPDAGEYMGWYVTSAFTPAIETETGKDRISIAVIWSGETVTGATPAPSAPLTPDTTPSPTIHNEKPVYKA